MRLNATALGLEDNILPYTNSCVMIDAVPAKFKPLWVMLCLALTIRCWSYKRTTICSSRVIEDRMT